MIAAVAADTGPVNMALLMAPLLIILIGYTVGCILLAEKMRRNGNEICFKTIGWPEMLLFLVIIVLIFGVRQISKIAGEMGSGIRAFKRRAFWEERPGEDAEDDNQTDESVD